MKFANTFKILLIILLVLLIFSLFYIRLENFENNYTISFVTFGGPSNKYRNRVKELTDQALSMNIFNNVYGFTDRDIKSDKIFWDRHKKFIESNQRGYGYWIC